MGAPDTGASSGPGLLSHLLNNQRGWIRERKQLKADQIVEPPRRAFGRQQGRGGSPIQKIF